MGRPRKSVQAAAVADNTTVLDVKPIKTLAPMFPAALGFHTAKPGPNSPNFMCVTPFGAPNAEAGSNPPGFTPGQMPPPMFLMGGGAGAASVMPGITPAAPKGAKTPKLKKTLAGSMSGQGKKRRGRPRKSEAAIATPVQIMSPPPVVSASTGHGKRGRGRPRKSEQIAA